MRYLRRPALSQVGIWEVLREDRQKILRIKALTQHLIQLVSLDVGLGDVPARVQCG